MINCLVLYAGYSVRASYYDDWLESFESHKALSVIKINICDIFAKQKLQKIINKVDFVVLLHSVNSNHVFYLDQLCSVLAGRNCVLLSFVGNEVSLPGCYLSNKRSVLNKILPDYIATQLPLEAGIHLWGDLVRESVLAVPHALNPNIFKSKTCNEMRPIDIGVRAFKYPCHLGDNDRNNLLDFFKKHSFGLAVDISSDRFDRRGWVSFLNKCKGTVSSEAGSWFLSKDDSPIKDFEKKFDIQASCLFNAIFFRKLAHKFPWKIRSIITSYILNQETNSSNNCEDDNEKFDFFLTQEKSLFYSKCISSRHFDAIGTRTAQILLEGRYNDILIPDEHYFSLHSDYSNIEEVIDNFKNDKLRIAITENAFSHVLEHHTYDKRIAQILKSIFKI
jgi:hypothetical protein